MSFPQGNDKVQLRDRALEKQSSSAPSMAELRAKVRKSLDGVEADMAEIEGHLGWKLPNDVEKLKSRPDWQFQFGQRVILSEVLAELDRVIKATILALEQSSSAPISADLIHGVVESVLDKHTMVDGDIPLTPAQVNLLDSEITQGVIDRIAKAPAKSRATAEEGDVG